MTPNNVDTEKRPKCSGALCGTRWEKNDAEPLHGCPYREDVENDRAFTCDCCDGCRRECANDV